MVSPILYVIAGYCAASAAICEILAVLERLPASESHVRPLYWIAAILALGLASHG